MWYLRTQREDQIMPRKPIDIKRFLIPRLRNLSRWWVNKNIARDQAKVKLEVGKTREGKPKYRVFYKCAECERQGIEKLHTREETQADHIAPVVDENTGFVDWNTFIERLFCAPEGYQILCLDHHENKTKKENKVRKKRKNS